MNHPSADQLTINSQFAVPVGVNFLPDSEKLNDALKTLILSKEQDPKVKNPYTSMHVGDALFESTFDFFAWPEACVQELKHFCQSTLKTFIASLVKQPEQLRNVSLHSHTWFHVTRKGGYFGLHNHGMASWSGVYCVDPGDVSDHPESGLLQFINPMAERNMFSDAANSHLNAPYSFNNSGYKLRPGQLVLFPAWLTHQVLPYQGDRPRITVAFNTWCQ